MKDMARLENGKITFGSIEQALDAWWELFSVGLAKIEEACRIYAAALDAFPEARKAFMARFPRISPDMLANFELVGRGQWDARVIDGIYAPVHHILRRLPISQQRELLDHGVDVLTVDSGMLRVQITDLSPDQIHQVFRGRIVRTEAQQRAWIEDQRSKALRKTPKNAETSIGFCGETLIVRQPGKYNMRDLIAQWSATAAR